MPGAIPNPDLDRLPNPDLGLSPPPDDPTGGSPLLRELLQVRDPALPGLCGIGI